jgi:ABC-2 type transport system ATP-binding protein
VLLNSHLLSEVELVCDRVAILARGKLVASGAMNELTQARGLEVETGAGVRLIADVGREQVPQVVRDLVAAGEEVYSVRLVRSTLEETFLELTGGDRA